MGVYRTTGITLLAYLVLCWWIGTWLHLRSPDLWILRGGLALIGLLAAGIFLWFQHHTGQARPASPEAAAPTDDIDLLVRDAFRQLKSSRLGRGAVLNQLPLVYLVGESGSTKTSTIVHSSLDPELLAGQAHQDSDIVPTRTANVWYSPQAVFVDVAGSMLADGGRWVHLIRLLQPGRVASAFRKGQQPPRAAIVFFDCENFFKPGASSAVQNAARKLAGRLQEVSQVLGISFPVYVLFTKVDRIPSFLDYVRRLNKEEASEVLGVTLPVRPQQSVGVYAEEEHRRLNKAFEELFYSLAERRIDLLARELEADKLPGIYEFPRDLRKVRGLLVDFLVDLARPSHLRVNPFLRGFYFSGVRPIMVDDVAMVEPEAVAAEPAVNAGATRIFSSAALPSAPPPLRAVGSSRKVPQWVFVTRLFNDVILKDRVALSASGTSTRVSLLRRVLLVAVMSVALLASIAFVVSFLGNRALESQVLDAANNIPAVQLKDKQLPSLEDLERLDRLRQALATLTRYQRQGAPWRLRWGLYVGDSLLPQARQLYFTRFRETLFGQTQQKLRDWMRGLPDTPAPSDSYEDTYNVLRAYLITTAFNQKSTPEFLAPVLLKRWAADREIPLDRKGLAQTQFEFYSTELALENPYSYPGNDSTEIEHTRHYLGKFSGIDRFYLPLVAKISQEVPSASLNEQFKETVGVVTGTYRVRGAFTANGVKLMQEAITHPAGLSAEEWVLGKAAASELDSTTLQQRLAERYGQDFLKEWHNLLSTSQVVAFSSPQDAQNKLDQLTSPASALLRLLWLISVNTDAGPQSAKDMYEPAQSVVPPGPAEKLRQSPNEAYISALSKLELAVSALNLNDPSTVKPLQDAANEARLAINQMAGKFRIDPVFRTETLVQERLEEPIKHAEDLVENGAREALRRAGEGLCKSFNAAMHGNYPFDPRSNQDLPLAQLGQLLAPPSGQLWTFYTENKLDKLLVLEGARYVSVPSGNISLSPVFVDFFNRAAALSKVLYPEGSSTPKFSYKLGQLSSDVNGLTVGVAGQPVPTSDVKAFTWTGNEDVQVSANGAPYGSYAGPWAVFRFVAGARWTDGAAGSANLERTIESNGQASRLPDGRVMYYRYQLQVSGVNPFRASEWSGLRCVSPLATPAR